MEKSSEKDERPLLAIPPGAEGCLILLPGEYRLIAPIYAGADLELVFKLPGTD